MRVALLACCSKGLLGKELGRHLLILTLVAVRRYVWGGATEGGGIVYVIHEGLDLGAEWAQGREEGLASWSRREIIA